MQLSMPDKPRGYKRKILWYVQIEWRGTPAGTQLQRLYRRDVPVYADNEAEAKTQVARTHSRFVTVCQVWYAWPYQYET